METANQRVMLSKRLLKEALLRLLEKKDIDRISVVELCAEAGINRATFYRHYRIPRDVLTEIEREMAEELHVRTGTPKSPAEIKNSLAEICRYASENADIFRVLARYNFDKELVGTMMDTYKSSGVFKWLALDRKIVDEDDVRLLCSYIAGGGFYLLRCWLTEDINKTPEEVAELIAGLFGVS